MRWHLGEVHGETNFKGAQQLCTTNKYKIKVGLSLPPATGHAKKIHCLSCFHVISDRGALDIFLRRFGPTFRPFHTTRDRIHESLFEFKVKHFHPVVRPRFINTVCFCNEWACHPQLKFCKNHIGIFKLKELYPFPHLSGTREDQGESKFHFRLSTKGGQRTPVHIEYNPRNLEAFTTDLTQRHLWNQIQESTQHLINIMKDRKLVEGGQDWLTFK